MKSKHLSILLCLAVIVVALFLLPGEASAAETGTCGDNLTWTLDDAGTLTISGTGAMTDFFSPNYAPWYAYREQITSAVIPKGVSSIGYYAFYNCSSLQSITIPDSITSIGAYAFRGCSSLKSITIPESVTWISDSAFSGCSSLESMTIPFVGDSRKTASDTYQYPFGYIFGTSSYNGSTATEQYYYGFSISGTTYDTYYIPSSLKSVTVTGGNILYGAFYNCSSLQSVTIGDSVTSIGEDAFEDCSSLQSITIGDSVTSIGDWAFEDCSSLKSITIPDSVTSIGHCAFYGCSSLTGVYISDMAAWCNVSFYVDNSNPLYYAHNLYLNGELVTELVIPESVTSIGDYAFSGCSSLTSVTIPDRVTSIGESAFEDCSSLTGITIPDSITGIGSHAFSGCSSLTSVTIPDSVTSIGYFAFFDCSSLTGITISDSVTSIGDYAFENCSSLNHVAYTGTQSQWKAISIGDYNTRLTKATRHYETSFQNVDNCVEIGVYCPVCELYITRTVKEGCAHTYSDSLDVACNACDYRRTATQISILRLPEKLGYVLFEDALDVTGGQLQLTYDDGSTGTIAMTSDMVTGFDNTVIGIQTLTVTYGGFTTTYTVEIAAQVPESVQIETLPNKLSYVTGDTLDLTGLTLTATYMDGQQATVTAAEVQGFADMTTPGVTTATVTFQGKQATFAIYVHPRGGMATVDSSLYPESAHNYSNNMDETKVLTLPGATKIVLTFNSSSATESNYDYVYILDGNGNQIGKYSGSLAGIVVTVPGDTVKIRLTSDSSTVKYGYAFSKIEADLEIQHPEVVLPGYPATFARPGLTDGTKCEICGEIIRQQQEIPQLVGRVANWNMTVADDLKVNFYLEISDEIISTTSVKLKINSKTHSYCAGDLTKTADGKYLVTANISAAQMNDDIVIMISSGRYLTTSATYSVKQYCDTLLGDEQYSRYHTLVTAMLHYGAMAQLYFDHGADDLVNNDITGAAAEDIPEQVESDMSITDGIDTISFYGASLVFKDRIAVRYYYRYDGDLSQYSFCAGDLPITYDIKDEMLCIEVADILPQNIDQQITLTVTDLQGNELTVTYGPMNYLVRMNQSGDTELKNLLKALYNYHLAAKAISA